MKGYLLTGPEALQVDGISLSELSCPVPADTVQIYKDINLETFEDVFKFYHYVIYPYYLTGIPVIIAVKSFHELEKKLISISDPLPVGCPLTGEKALRHLQRLHQIKKKPGKVSYTPVTQPEYNIPLDPDQSRAATHYIGPCLCVAPAGSGKTMTIIARNMLLIQRDVEPERILNITFTKKAKKEMQERLVNALGPAGKKIMVKTFHALAFMLITELTGQEPKIFTSRIDTLLGIIKEVDETIPLDAADAYISNNLNSLRLPELIAPKDEWEEKLQTIYQLYQNYVEKTGFYDQDNLLVQLYKLLRDNPEKRRYLMDNIPRGCNGKTGGRWHFVMVDESQDNNLAQEILSRFLATPWDNIYYVGDEDQILYGFRGSSVERILNIKDSYPNLKEIYLKTNYRSHPEIVEAADSVIRNNTMRRQKIILPHRKDSGQAVWCYRFEDPLTELKWVSKRCRALIDSGVNPDDICIIYRTNAQADVCAMELSKEKVPYYIHRTGPSLFETAESQAIVNYLSVLQNPKDTAALSGILKYHSKNSIDLLKKAKGSNYILDSLKSEAGTSREFGVVDFCNNMKTFSVISKRFSDVGHMVGYAVDKFKLNRLFGDSESSDRLGIIQSVAEKFTNLDSFLKWVNKAKKQPKPDKAEGKIQLMTVHSSKGLEFPIVSIINFSEGHIPHVYSKDIEEERRIAYVAITRAKDQLTITGYSNNSRDISRFFDETGKEIIELNCGESETDESAEDEVQCQNVTVG